MFEAPLNFRQGSFSESQLFVLCSDLRTARSVGYTGLILRETQLQLPVTASSKSTQHTYHTLRCRGPFALIHPCIGAYARVNARLCYCEFPRMSLLGDWVNRGHAWSIWPISVSL